MVWQALDLANSGIVVGRNGAEQTAYGFPGTGILPNFLSVPGAPGEAVIEFEAGVAGVLDGHLPMLPTRPIPHHYCARPESSMPEHRA